MKRTRIVVAVVAVFLLILVRASMFTVREWEQVVVTQFGHVVESHAEPGLKFRTPFIQQVHRFSKRYLAWDGDPDRMPTRDKRNIWIDTFARWRITDAEEFLTSVGAVRDGQQRLDGRIDGAVRDIVGRHDLIEVVRSTNRQLQLPEDLQEGASERVQFEITAGREQMEVDILGLASRELAETFGIELADVRIKGIGYVESVQLSVYERMKAERQRIAERYLSEARAERARILGETQRQLDIIEGDGYQKSTEIRGEADAEAMRIYAEAINEGREFYTFLRALQAYRESLSGKTRIILTTDSEFLRYLREADPEDASGELPAGAPDVRNPAE